MRGDHLPWFVEQPYSCIFFHRGVHACLRTYLDIAFLCNWPIAVSYLSIYLHHPLLNQLFCLPPRSYSQSCQSLGKSFCFGKILNSARIDEFTQRIVKPRQSFFFRQLFNTSFGHVSVDEILVESAEVFKRSLVLDHCRFSCEWSE